MFHLKELTNPSKDDINIVFPQIVASVAVLKHMFSTHINNSKFLYTYKDFFVKINKSSSFDKTATGSEFNGPNLQNQCSILNG